MELIIALVLFVGLILCWAFLPGTSSSAVLSAGMEGAEGTATANIS